VSVGSYQRYGLAFATACPPLERDGDLVAAYYRLLNDEDARIREVAARDWCDWEEAAVSLEPGYQPNPRYDDPRFRMAFARIVTHYFHHQAWLEDGILLREANRLAGIPGVLVHGRLDLGSPALTPGSWRGLGRTPSFISWVPVIRAVTR
jgi:proline iminopeptidase